MNILFDNVDLTSQSGPNSFARKLKKSLDNDNHSCISLSDTGKIKPDIQLSFIQSGYKIAPMVQRLDGIYFNTDQDYNFLNKMIYSTYKSSNAVIFQSEFNKALIEEWFGKHDNSFVIHNGTNIDEISSIEKLDHEIINSFKKIWTCASSWRPHKRLKDNIRYFLENSDEDTCLIIAGNNPDHIVNHSRIFYVGMLAWKSLISLYKVSEKFIHLAWLDHCPNVVVDAVNCGCQIVCSSAGGTREIAGKNAIVIKENEWDYKPVKLYEPPDMDFSKVETNDNFDLNLDMENVSTSYTDVFKGIL